MSPRLDRGTERPLLGVAFPFRIHGGLERAAGAEKVAQNLRHLLSTRLGERTLRRDYGGGVHRRLQEGNDPALRALVQHEIESALRTFLPELRLTSPVALAAEEERLFVHLEYTADPGEPVRRLEVEVR